MLGVTGGATKLVVCQEGGMEQSGIFAGGQTILFIEVLVAAADHADTVLGIAVRRDVFAEGVCHDFGKTGVNAITAG